MGYIRHDAVIAIGYLRDKESADALAAEIDALRSEMGDEARILVGPVTTAINGDTMYVYLPDGSKEGWDTSERHDAWRERFQQIVARQEWWDVLTARFGGDDVDVMEATVSRAGHIEAATYSGWQAQR